MDYFFNDGALKYLDGVSYHPYYNNDPYITVDAGDVNSIVKPGYSAWLGGINFIGGKVDKLVNDNGGFKEVYDTEVGYHTVPNEAVPLSEIVHTQAKNTVSLDNLPKYIYGVSTNFYANSVSTNAPIHYDKLLQKVTETGIVNAVNALKSAALSQTTLPASTAALAQLNANYQVGTDIANLWGNGSLTVSEEAFMGMLFDLHSAGQKWASLYAAALQNEGVTATFNNTKVNAAISKVQGKLNPAYYTTLTISEELLRHAKQHSAKSEFVSAPAYYPGNPGKTAVVAYEQILSEKLADWTSQIADFETVNDYASVLMYVDFTGRPAENKMDIAPGGEKPATVQIDNTRRNSAITNVTVVALTDNGQQVSESAVFTVPAGGTVDISMAIKVPATLIGGKHVYKLALKQNGQIISTRSLGVNVSGFGDIFSERITHSEVPGPIICEIRMQYRPTIFATFGRIERLPSAIHTNQEKIHV
jgi:hypothetical protein